MFDLEGTKHEKALLITAAYIIGLTSGYIAFHFQGEQYHHKALYKHTPVPMMGYTPPTSQPPAIEESAIEPTNNDGTVLGDMAVSEDMVFYEDGRLYAEAPSGRLVLSIDQSALGDEIPDYLQEQGTHITPPPFAVSPDEKFVFFCEQTSSDPLCTAFLYDATETAIRFVREGAAKLVIPTQAAATALWNENGLVIDTMTSVSPETPWIVE